MKMEGANSIGENLGEKYAEIVMFLDGPKVIIKFLIRIINKCINVSKLNAVKWKT